MDARRQRGGAAARRPGGFTLVELLVALLVMSIMAVLAWQGLDGILRAREAGQTNLERSARMQTVLAQWEQDLLALQDSARVPAILFDGATLRLTRRTDAGVQVVVWSLRARALWRWTAAPTTRAGELQQSWLASQQLLGSEPGHLKMLDGVAGWQLYFFFKGRSSGETGGWTNAQSSRGPVSSVPALPASGASAPPRPARERLPDGVRAVLAFDGNEAATLTRDIALAPTLQP